MEHATIGCLAVTATQPVGAARRSRDQHADVILILGLDFDEVRASPIIEACKKAQLSLEVIGDGRRPIVKSDIEKLHRNGLFGADTHVMIVGHGSTDDVGHTSLGHQDKGSWSSTDLISALLTPPQDQSSSARGSRFIHFLTCQAGSLKTQFTPEHEAWGKAACLVYASTKNVAGTILHNAIAVIELLADCRQRGLGAPGPHHVLAKVLATTGECVTLFGGTLTQAETYHAPKSANDVAVQTALALAWQDYLEETILSRQGRPSDVNYDKGRDSRRALESAFLTRIMRRDDKAVQTFLEHDSSLAQASGVDGVSALMRASTKGYVEIINNLIRFGAKLDTAGPLGLTALHLACNGKHADVAEMLIRAGANVNSRAENGETPLLLSCANGDVELAQFLLIWQADIDGSDADGETPLIAATKSGGAEVVKLLLERGAYNNAVDKTGETALHWACKNDNVQITTLLLESSYIDPDVRNKLGLSPLLLAIETGSDELITALVNGRTDINIQDRDGYALLHHACAQGNGLLTNLLLNSHRAAINARTPDGDTPLHLACAQSHHHFVEALIDHGAKANLANHRGRTPLMLAAIAASPATVRELLKAKARHKLRDEDGFTALMHACTAGTLETVSVLLGSGASPNISDRDGKTAFDLVTLRLAQDPDGRNSRRFEGILKLLENAATKKVD